MRPRCGFHAVKNTAALVAPAAPLLEMKRNGMVNTAVAMTDHFAFNNLPSNVNVLNAVPGLAGIKEYYGLVPDQEDANLRMTGLFFNDTSVTEDAALATLARPYGAAAADVIQFWRLTSEAMELFPWEATWVIRAIGRADPAHSLSAALVRGVPWHTPSWCSTACRASRQGSTG